MWFGVSDPDSAQAKRHVDNATLRIPSGSAAIWRRVLSRDCGCRRCTFRYRTHPGTRQPGPAPNTATWCRPVFSSRLPTFPFALRKVTVRCPQPVGPRPGWVHSEFVKTGRLFQPRRSAPYVHLCVAQVHFPLRKSGEHSSRAIRASSRVRAAPNRYEVRSRTSWSDPRFDGCRHIGIRESPVVARLAAPAHT